MKYRSMVMAASMAAMSIGAMGQAPPQQAPRIRPAGSGSMPPSQRQLAPEDLAARQAEHQTASATVADERVLADEPDMQRMAAGHPLGCKRRIRVNGRPDNFAPGPEPRYQSPVMQRFLTGKAQKGFDAVTLDSVFGVSFPLGTCKLCGDREPVIIDMVVRRSSPGQLSPNDKIHVYLSNAATPPGQLGTLVQTIQPWQGAPFNMQLQRSVQFQIPTSVINQHVWNSPGPAYLEVVMQDDTGIDYVRMISLTF